MTGPPRSLTNVLPSIVIFHQMNYADYQAPVCRDVDRSFRSKSLWLLLMSSTKSILQIEPFLRSGSDFVGTGIACRSCTHHRKVRHFSSLRTTTGCQLRISFFCAMPLIQFRRVFSDVIFLGKFPPPPMCFKGGPKSLLHHSKFTHRCFSLQFKD